MNPSVKSDLEIRATLHTMAEELARSLGEQTWLATLSEEPLYEAGIPTPRRDLVHRFTRCLELIQATLDALERCPLAESNGDSIFVPHSPEPDHFRSLDGKAVRS